MGDVECEARPSGAKKVVILGGGPNRIGQGIEFDYCCCHACFALTAAGYETIMINCNPETVSTDYDTSDRLYFEPLTLEDVLEVIHAEQQSGELLGVVVQLGGQTALGLAQPLKDAGIPVNDANNTDNFQPGTSARRKMEAMVFTMTKTPLGRLCVSDHAMHAVSEMKYLDEAFDALRRQTGTAMPMWEKLRNEMPSWDSLQQNRKAAK